MPEPVGPSEPGETVGPSELTVEVDVAAFLPDAEPADADQLGADLDRVEAALAALDARTYGLDPETGRPIADELLAEDPTRLS